MTIYDALTSLLGDVPDDFYGIVIFLTGISFLMFLSWVFDLIYVVICNFFRRK